MRSGNGCDANDIKAIRDYAADWRRMFSNAQVYNMDDSQIFLDLVFLEGIFEGVLRGAAEKHGLLSDLLPETE